MRHQTYSPALIVHGGAGGRAPANERPGRRRGLLAAVEAGARILQEGGPALDAAIAAVIVLEDDPLFNAGCGSCLTTDGRVEMDAGVATFTRGQQNNSLHSGGVVMISRVRNPIVLARAVMDRTPHLLVGGAGAEQFARGAGIPLCRPEAMIAARARERWRAALSRRASPILRRQHGTVGAVALDSRGNLAAATSTGGVSGKMRGRIGDSAILGAGFFASALGAASATGEGEAIIKSSLCRCAVERLGRESPQSVAASTISQLYRKTGGEAGIILIDSRARMGFAHNAAAMEIATFSVHSGAHHALAPRV